MRGRPAGGGCVRAHLFINVCAAAFRPPTPFVSLSFVVGPFRFVLTMLTVLTVRTVLTMPTVLQCMVGRLTPAYTCIPKKGGRSLESVFADLKRAADQYSASLSPALFAYREEHALHLKLNPIRLSHSVPNPADRDTHAEAGANSGSDESDGDGDSVSSSSSAARGGAGDAAAGGQPGASPSAALSCITVSSEAVGKELNQSMWLRCLDVPMFKLKVQDHFGTLDEGMLRVMHVVAYYAEAQFDAKVEQVVGASHRGSSAVRKAGPKHAQRMYNKLKDDHKHGTPPRVGLNLDVLRTTIVSASPEAQLAVWKDVVATFGDDVLRVKNMFVTEETLPTPSDPKAGETEDAAATKSGLGGGGNEAGEQALAFVLINVVLRLTKDDGSPLTFADMIEGDPEGFATAVDRCAASVWKKTSFYPAPHDDVRTGAAMLAAWLPDIGDQQVVLVAELQLLLSFFLEAKKQTHLWYKVSRCDDAAALRHDCVSYMDRV